MFLNHINKFLYGEGFLHHPDGDLSILSDVTDDKVDDDTDDNKDGNKENEDEDTESEELENKEGDEDKDKKDDENEEDKEDETTEEDEEVDEENEDKDRVTYAKDIKAKYPDFFKEFPDIKAALYRDQRFSEIFGSVKDAESTVAKASALEKIEDDLLNNGDSSELLDTIKKNSPESYDKVLTSILTHTREKDKETYLKIAAVPIKQVLRAAFRTGGKDDKGNYKDLAKAALLLHKYYFDDYELNEPVEFEGGEKKEGKTKAQIEYERKLTEINTREFNSFQSSIDNSYVSKMTNHIREGLDKDDRLTEYTKSKIVDDILVEIKNTLNNDDRYKAQMTSLWRKAASNNYANDSKSSIINAALARAKSLVAEVRKKVVSEALKSKSSKEDKDKNKDKNTERNRNDNRREIRKESRRESESKKPKSDLEILREA
jgi:hypothetical protein